MYQHETSPYTHSVTKLKANFTDTQYGKLSKSEQKNWVLNTPAELLTEPTEPTEEGAKKIKK